MAEWTVKGKQGASKDSKGKTSITATVQHFGGSLDQQLFIIIFSSLLFSESRMVYGSKQDYLELLRYPQNVLSCLEINDIN